MKRFAVMAMALMMCPAFFACSEQSPAPPPAHISTVTPTPEPVTSSALNPVSIFFTGYYSACQPILSSLGHCLGGNTSIDAAESILYLADHNISISIGQVSFGRILSTDRSGFFSSDVSGAAAGSGTISIAEPGYDLDLLAIRPTAAPEDTAAEDAQEDIDGEAADEPITQEPSWIEDTMPTLPIIPIVTVIPSPTPLPSATPAPDPMKTVYLLRFTTTSGEYLYGTLQGNSLSFSSDPAGSHCQLVLEDGIWISTVTRPNGVSTRVTCSDSGARFSVFRLSGQSETVLHSWAWDSSGVKYIDGKGLV